MTKTCLECKTKLNGRSDKKFCSDYCRNSYNNKLNRDHTVYMRKVNNNLRKNRRILAKFNPKGKGKVHRMALLEEGFNFHYFTNIYRTKAGKEYYFCYDQGYIQIDEDTYALVVKQDYVKF